jgi:hypothetical protein
MNIIKYFAKARGIESLTIGDISLPIDIALDDDQMAPIFVSCARLTFEGCGVFDPSVEFPWDIAIQPDNDVALFDGSVVIDKPSTLPISVGYLFIDYELETLIHTQMLQQGLDTAPHTVSIEGLFNRLETLDNEPKQFKRAPLELGL